MILERLVLNNFRQFKGRHEIVFSDVRERNVTIVHAENGFGKTTLLKALLWGFYGKNGLLGTDGRPDDFEKPDSIVHEGLAHRAQDPDTVNASVQITFKHDMGRYILTRQLSLSQQNVNSKQTELTLEIMQNGQTFRQERPQERIEAIIPEGIRGFLFFNGERINYLAMEANRDKVTEAIHQMLGLRLLKTTIEDLHHQNVRGKLRTELNESASAEKRDLNEQLGALEAKAAEKQERRKQIRANLEAITKELNTVDNKLAANREARDLQTRRVHLQAERDELAARCATLTQRLAKIISEDGYSIFGTGLIGRGRAITSQLRSEGKIPARVLNSFLQELLDSRVCICKRHLDVETPERAAVEGLLTIAGDQDFNNAVGALDHAIGLMEGIANQTQEQLRDLNSERLEFGREVRSRDEELHEIHQRLGGKKDEEVHQLEEKRKELLLERDAQNAEDIRLEEQLKRIADEIKSLTDEIRRIEDKEESAARAQRRVNAVEDCINLLEEILAVETEDLRPVLNKEIDSHFRKIMKKDYWAELTENFTLRIRKHILGGEEVLDAPGIDVALSTGERTVTSLVFIASLVALAYRRSEIPTILKGLAGSAYPIVIDSPFGSLSMFREGVARHIPELAPQVLLLVSPEQYDGQVEFALNESGRVGKRYYLTYHGPTMPERANRDLTVNGQTIQQFFPCASDEYAEIRPL